MTYQSDRKIRLETRLTQTQTTLALLYTAMDEMAASGVKSYAFDSGEGSQKTTRRSLSEILESIQQLTATESHIINELSRMGLVSVRLRRYSQ